MASAGAPRESVAAGCGWRLVAADQLEWREWGDEFVVFNGVTASTHLIGAAAGAVLMTLLNAQAALTATQIFGELFGDDASTDDAALPAEPGELAGLETILLDFDRLRIVRQVIG